MREGQRADPKFSFSTLPTHTTATTATAWTASRRARPEAEPKAKDKLTEAAEPVAPVDVGEEPPAALFVLDLPSISAIDLCVPIHFLFFLDILCLPNRRDIMKLTRAVHRAPRAQLPSDAVRTGRAELPVRLFAADTLAIRVLQSARRAVHARAAARACSSGETRRARAGGCTVDNARAVAAAREVGKNQARKGAAAQDDQEAEKRACFPIPLCPTC